jgi:hypothetical protein
VHRFDDTRIEWDAPRRCRNSRCVVPPQVVRCKVRQLSRPFSGRHRRGGPTDTKRPNSWIAEGRARAVVVVIELTASASRGYTPCHELSPSLSSHPRLGPQVFQVRNRTATGRCAVEPAHTGFEEACPN